MKESYIKLPNITVGKLQDVVDFLDDNNIEYIEEYKENEEIERLKEEYVMLQNASDEVEEEKDREIERLNNRVSELEKGVSRKEEQITNLDDENFDLENEIERLNNIINELEKDIKNLYTYGIKNNREQKDYLLNRLEGLKALKGVDKE